MSNSFLFSLAGTIAALIAGAPIANALRGQSAQAVRLGNTIRIPLTDAEPDQPAMTRITRSKDGLFYLNAAVNGRTVRFLVDTGATTLVLSGADAGRIGFDLERLRFDRHLNTAAGNTRIAMAELKTLRVAGQSFARLPAVIVRDHVGVSLLGQDMLRRLGAIAIDGDDLIFRSRQQADR